MTITLPQYPPAEPVPASEGRAWLEWNADTDELQLSAAAQELLGLQPMEAPVQEAELVALFKKPSQSKLAIALEDILTQGECQAVELLRQTSAGAQLVLFNGRLDTSRPGRLVIAGFDDITNSSDGQQHLASKSRFQIFINLLQQECKPYRQQELQWVYNTKKNKDCRRILLEKIQ